MNLPFKVQLHFLREFDLQEGQGAEYSNAHPLLVQARILALATDCIGFFKSRNEIQVPN